MQISREARNRAAAFKPSPKMIESAYTVFQAMAWVETVKPIVRGYQQAILDYEKYYYAKKWIDRGEHTHAEWISNPDHTYLMDDEGFKHYIKRCNEERIKAGLHVDSEEYCPLLVAENMLIKARWALIEIMEPITHIRLDDLYKLEHQNELVELTLRMLAPYVKIGKEA